jgi:hypothetical protein
MSPLEIGALRGGLGACGWGSIWFPRQGLSVRQVLVMVFAFCVLGLMADGGFGIVIQVILSAAEVTEPVVYR